MSTGGGRQEVSGDELRLLADSAAQTSFDVAALRQRVQDIVNGVDRRGWNAGAFDEQWGQTRFGLGMLATELEDNHQELLVRSDEADLLNTREFIAGAIVLADTDPALGFGPDQVATWPTIAPNPDVDWSQVVALGPSDFNQFATPYSDIDLSPEPIDPWKMALGGLNLFLKAAGDAPTSCNDAFLKLAQAVQEGPEAVRRALQNSRPSCGQSRSLVRLTTVLGDGTPLDVQQEMSFDEFAAQMASIADQLGGGGAGVRRVPVRDDQPPPPVGPGAWVQVNRNGVSDRALEYQNRITGSRAGWEYRYNGVHFDGYDAQLGALLEAKGERYAYLLDPKNSRWSTAAEGIVDEASRQVVAAKGQRVIWYVAEEGAAKRITQIFADNDITGIQVTFKP